MITGTAQMAPACVRATKTEWLYRLLQEPRRLFRRYFVECLPVFLKHVLPTYVRQPAAPLPSQIRVPDQHRIPPRRLNLSSPTACHLLSHRGGIRLSGAARATLAAGSVAARVTADRHPLTAVP